MKKSLLTARHPDPTPVMVDALSFPGCLLTPVEREQRGGVAYIGGVMVERKTRGVGGWMGE